MIIHREHLMLALAILTACESPSAEMDPAQVPVLALSESPTLEIGVVEGADDYVFQDVRSVLRLASGNVVAADVGASRILKYDPAGVFLRRWGGQGEGPGEFKNLVRLYPVGTDSLMALDGWVGRMSLFDTAGVFSHQDPVSDLSSDSLFALDVWLYGRFWVDGALGDEQRSLVRRALDGLPQPVSEPGYRFVRVAHDGRLWIREPDINTDGTRTWTVVGPGVGPEALIRIPARFDPQTLAEGEVLGRWQGDNDVHFVRAYDVTDTGARAPLPDWLTSTEATGPVEAPDQDAFMGEITTAFRGMAIAQEKHYAAAGTYTARMDSLVWEQPERVWVSVINAGPRGWVAVFTHPALDRMCALGYGYTIPPGWTPGEVVCGPPSEPTSPSTN